MFHSLSCSVSTPVTQDSGGWLVVMLQYAPVSFTVFTTLPMYSFFDEQIDIYGLSV